MNEPAWDASLEVKKLREERAELRRLLRYERRRVDQWRRRYGLLQDQLRTLTRGRLR